MYNLNRSFTIQIRKLVYSPIIIDKKQINPLQVIHYIYLYNINRVDINEAAQNSKKEDNLNNLFIHKPRFGGLFPPSSGF